MDTDKGGYVGNFTIHTRKELLRDVLLMTSSGYRTALLLVEEILFAINGGSLHLPSDVSEVLRKQKNLQEFLIYGNGPICRMVKCRHRIVRITADLSVAKWQDWDLYLCVEGKGWGGSRLWTLDVYFKSNGEAGKCHFVG